VKLEAYVLCGILASLAGLFLAARVGIGDPNVGGTYQFDSITASVLGGVSLAGGEGTLWGVIAGAVVLQVIGNSLNLLGVTSYWQWIIKGCLLVIFVAAYAFHALPRRVLGRLRGTPVPQEPAAT
jgi:ribose/xylose/arabinose/galactoside ABC-type transport system permease subunit